QRGAAGPRRRPAVRDPGNRELRRQRRPVHAEDRRDRGRAREADAPRARPHRSQAAAPPHRVGQGGAARGRLRPARPEGRMAAPPLPGDPAMTDPPGAAGTGPAVRIRDVRLAYGATRALDGVTADLPAGCLTGLIGPDGVGKSSLLSLVAGARAMQDGRIEVLGGDIADPRHRRAVQPRIAYMPQGLGRNLYLTLSVFE